MMPALANLQAGQYRVRTEEEHYFMAYTSTADRSVAGVTYGLPVRVFLYWLPVALAITVLSGLVYVAVQQDLRQGANDPQIQMAEDAAVQLEAGQQPAAVVGAGKVDMAR